MCIGRTRSIRATLLTGAVLLTVSCGGAEVSDKLRRKSDRMYEAASIAWYDQHDPLTAIRNLTRAIDTNPANDHAHYLLGIIRFGRAEYDAAEKHLRETVRLRQDADPAGLSGAQNNLGLLLIHQKKLNEAVTLLEASSGEVLNREPWLALGNLGWAYIELGKYDKAIEVLRRALFDQPRFCVGLYRLGQAYYHKKEFDEAKKAIEQAVSVPEPGCDAMQEAHHLLGMIHLRLGDDAKATECFSRCREIGEHTEIGSACVEALTGL